MQVKKTPSSFLLLHSWESPVTNPHRAAHGRLIHATRTRGWRPSRHCWRAGGVTESRRLSLSKWPQIQQMFYCGGWGEARWAQQEIAASAVKYVTREEEERAPAPRLLPIRGGGLFKSGAIWQWIFFYHSGGISPCFEMRSPANCTCNQIQSFCWQQAAAPVSLHPLFLLPFP